MTRCVRVARADDRGGGVRELTLVARDGAALASFSPGSHVVVHVPGERTRKNAYSLACAPWSTDAYRIAVRRLAAGRGGSRALHDQICVDDELEIEPPRNLFAPRSDARRHVLVAGGIGITPFVSYVHQLLALGTPFELHHVFRGDAPPPLLDELGALCQGCVHGHAGRAALHHALDGALADQPLGTHLSVCGPTAMMEAVMEAARGHGWPAARVHMERFAIDDRPKDPFTVTLAGSDRRVDVGADVTLLEALEEAGVTVPYMCRQGVCGECRVAVLDGTPDHRDVFLSAQERADDTAIMPCVSRCAAGTLVLDLA